MKKSVSLKGELNFFCRLDSEKGDLDVEGSKEESEGLDTLMGGTGKIMVYYMLPPLPPPGVAQSSIPMHEVPTLTELSALCYPSLQFLNLFCRLNNEGGDLD